MCVRRKGNARYVLREKRDGCTYSPGRFSCRAKSQNASLLHVALAIVYMPRSQTGSLAVSRETGQVPPRGLFPDRHRPKARRVDDGCVSWLSSIVHGTLLRTRAWRWSMKHLQQPPSNIWLKLCAVSCNLDLPVRVPWIAQTSGAVERQSRSRDPFDGELAAPIGVSIGCGPVRKTLSMLCPSLITS